MFYGYWKIVKFSRILCSVNFVKKNNNSRNSWSFGSSTAWHWPLSTEFLENIHCVERFFIRSFSGPYFAAFRLNTEIYSAWKKIQTRNTPNTGTFHTEIISKIVESDDSDVEILQRSASPSPAVNFCRMIDYRFLLCVHVIQESKCHKLCCMC